MSRGAARRGVKGEKCVAGGCAAVSYSGVSSPEDDEERGRVSPGRQQKRERAPNTPTGESGDERGGAYVHHRKKQRRVPPQ
mmetsp:Transcript_6878/g.28725  ORF Transcript_6878/g.28725 Transcript_6878/m.28725 type:complete len:81 (+) Transcript_6878:149-391(+)